MLTKSVNRIRGVGSRLKRMMYENGVGRAHQQSVKNNPGDYEIIGKILSTYRADGGLNHDFQAYKLFELRQLLGRIKPRNILELGSGSSTAVFADYVRCSTEPCFVCSVDDNEDWLDQAKNMAWGDTDPSGKAEFIYAPRAVNEQSVPPQSRYDIDLNSNYDFVFIDGPPMRVGTKKNKSMVNSNVFDLLESNPPKTIIVDIRRPTVAALRAHCSGDYDVTVSDVILSQANRENYNYFSVFERREDKISN